MPLDPRPVPGSRLSREEPRRRAGLDIGPREVGVHRVTSTITTG